MNVNVWDVNEEIRELIRSGGPLDARRSAADYPSAAMSGVSIDGVTDFMGLRGMTRRPVA